MRVLFASHTGIVGGAEHALLDVLAHLPAEVEPVVASPSGPLAEAVGARGIQVEAVPEVAAGIRLHPRRTPQALTTLVRAGRALRRVVSSVTPDVIHANSTRTALAAATYRGGPPVVTWVHDVLPPGAAAALVARTVAARSSRVVANSHHTARAFAGRARGRVPSVVHNGVDLGRFDRDALTRAGARSRVGWPADAPALGVVAQISPWKGQDLAVEVLARLRSSVPDIHLYLAGETKFVGESVTHDNPAFRAALEQRIARDGLGDAVTFLGERSDVPVVLRALDLVLVPSWDEPFGRVVLEAMAMGTPVLATAVGGPGEVLDDGRTGRLLPPQRPELWAEAAADLLADADARERMADAAHAEVERFSIASCVEHLVREYELAIAA